MSLSMNRLPLSAINKNEIIKKYNHVNRIKLEAIKSGFLRIKLFMW